MATQWDPTQTQDSDVISNGGLTVTDAATAVEGSTRATVSHASGKWQFEVVYSGPTNYSNINVGICQASHNRATWVSYDNLSWGYWAIAGVWFNSATFDGGPVGWTCGDVIGVCIDADAGKLWFTKNGAVIGGNGGNPATGTLGYSIGSGIAWYPAVSIYNGNSSNAATAKFSGLTYPVSGFTQWDGGGAQPAVLNLAGAGSLTASLAQLLGTVSTLTGTGALTAQIAQRLAALPTQWSGAGALTSNLAQGLATRSALAGAGGLTADLTQSAAVAMLWQALAALAGSGGLNAALSVNLQALAALSGLGGMSTALSANLRALTALSGLGGLSAALNANLQAAALLAGSGNLQATLQLVTELLASQNANVIGQASLVPPVIGQASVTQISGSLAAVPQIVGTTPRILH
jgi:SPRY domain